MGSMSLFDKIKQAFGGKNKRIAELEKANAKLQKTNDEQAKAISTLETENGSLRSENDTLKGEFRRISDYLTEEK